MTHLGRPTHREDRLGQLPAGVITSYTHDSQSRRTTITAPATTDTSGVRPTQARVTTTSPGRQRRQSTTSTCSAAIRTGFSTTDVRPRVQPTRPDGRCGGKGTSHGYDRFGNRTSMVDANGNRYDWAYTAQNKVAEVRLRDWRSDPEGAPGTGTGDYLVLHRYIYDFAGRLASDTDAMGRRLEYEYYRDDLLQKVTLKDFHNPDGSKRDYVVEENTYDGAGHLDAEGRGERHPGHPTRLRPCRKAHQHRRRSGRARPDEHLHVRRQRQHHPDHSLREDVQPSLVRSASVLRKPSTTPTTTRETCLPRRSSVTDREPGSPATPMTNVACVPPPPIRVAT